MSEKPSKPRRFDRDVDGILLLDKSLGLSSNAALQQARVLFRALKAGHAGSLDPLASGMLPVCFGQATKVCAFLLDARKTYRFTARLGVRTDTGDAEGTVIQTETVPSLTEPQINAVFAASMGLQSQVPPMYSALKHEGQRLYAIARRGETVERPARQITIEALSLMTYNGTELDVTVRCSKGTYVRTLAEDLANRLGTVAHLTALRRVQVDPFATQAMHTFDELNQRAQSGLAALDELLIPSDQALLHLAAYHFDADGQMRLLRGQSAAAAPGVAPLAANATPGATVRLYGPDELFLGVGQVVIDGSVQPRRLLAKSDTGQ